MEIFIEYEENQYLNIEKISVIGEFNNYNSDMGIMQKVQNKWVFKTDLKAGEYKYKFLINDKLKLNDPSANIYLPDDNEELWSVIMINEENQRLFNNNQYTVHVEDYCITATITEQEEVVSKKSFSTSIDEKVVTRFKFTNVTGLHTVTTAWYTPQGQLFQVTENNLFAPPNQNEPVKLWFWMDLKEDKPINGNWTMKMFIDGEFILEDEFSLMDKLHYSSKGRIV